MLLSSVCLAHFPNSLERWYGLKYWWQSSCVLEEVCSGVFPFYSTLCMQSEYFSSPPILRPTSSFVCGRNFPFNALHLICMYIYVSIRWRRSSSSLSSLLQQSAYACRYTTVVYLSRTVCMNCATNVMCSSLFFLTGRIYCRYGFCCMSKMRDEGRKHERCEIFTPSLSPLRIKLNGVWLDVKEELNGNVLYVCTCTMWWWQRESPSNEGGT